MSRREIKAFAVPAAGAPFQEFTYTSTPLGPKDVEVKIECCGVCHSDLHQAKNEWGGANYPLVPGHEIIGRITAVGSEVTEFKVGDRVGVSPQIGHCKTCNMCQKGLDNHCRNIMFNYNSKLNDEKQPFTYGGFAEYHRCPAEWAFHIPDALPSHAAAPLLCAGLTTWMPFVNHNIKAGMKVGILGVGGLGHIALQWANKLGCHTVALSSSPDKEAEAKKFGAHEFLCTKDQKQIEAAADTFDFILSTVSADIDWTPYLVLLKPEGVLACVGLPVKMSFRPGPIINKKLVITGSLLCSRKEIQNMLNFAAQHGVVAAVETLPMTAANCDLAMKKLEENKARYRVVLVNENFDKN